MSKINIYNCSNGHQTVTKDTANRDTTPFMITCPKCRKTANSSFYDV